MASFPPPIKPTISLEELERVDIRVGTIETLSDVAKSNKLARHREPW